MVTERSTGDTSKGFKTLFEQKLLEIGQDVVRIPVTKTTSNIESDETLTDGTSESIRVSFKRQFRRWTLDKEGSLEGGDVRMFTRADQTINKDDKITFKDKTYRVDQVIDRYVGNTLNYKDCSLFLVSNG